MYNFPFKEHRQQSLRVVALTPLLTSETNMDFVLPSMEMFLFLGCTTEKLFLLHATSIQTQKDYDNLKQ